MPALESKYRVVLHAPFAHPNELDDMTETALYGFLGTRLGSEEKADTLIQELEKNGKMTTNFENPTGATRVEIRRVESPTHSVRLSGQSNAPCLTCGRAVTFFSGSDGAFMSETKYFAEDTLVRFKCPEHGEFEIRAGDVRDKLA